LKMLKEKSPAEAVEIMSKTIEGWIQLTDDALSSTEAAVDVLNDLLNYDKIESGTLRLEFSSVPIWQVLKKTTAGFVMQAKEKRSSLSSQASYGTGSCLPPNWSSTRDCKWWATLCAYRKCCAISCLMRSR
jgi:signal transduction histidine kinase